MTPSSQSRVLSGDGRRDDLLPVLWLCGAPAAGKSVTAWNLYQAHRGEQVAYVDIDQLKMLFPETGDPFRLAAANLSTLAHQHRLLGTQALIVSGVIEPDELAQIDRALAADATVTWCLVDSDDATLRDRIAERGWPQELAGLAVADAHALRAAPIGHRIDTTSLDPGAAAEAADTLLRLRAPSAAAARPAKSAVTSDLVVIYGPRAVGKSALSWGLLMDFYARGDATGYLDADQLGFVHVDAARRDRLVADAVTAIARTFAEAGAVRTIVNGNLGPDLVAALADTHTTLVELVAEPETIGRRIAARSVGNVARLGGDDLEAAGPDTQAAVLADALAQHRRYLAARLPSHRLNVDADEPARHIAAILGLLGRGGEQPATAPSDPSD